jgi:ankyrin repeat protein
MPVQMAVVTAVLKAAPEAACVPSRLGSTPLHFAARSDKSPSVAMITALLAAGADPLACTSLSHLLLLLSLASPDTLR